MEALPAHWVSALFRKLQARYGHKWTSSVEGIEETAVAEWGEVLAGLTGEEVKTGLESWDGLWPPSAVEFRKACLGIPECEEHRSGAYRAFERGLPPPPADKEKAKAAFDDIRAVLRGEKSVDPG